ncbi:radical SAM protein [Nocardiopsis dassonvillei]|uniref:radical SAM protein n=1 Tax=Nocardiopsis dassonvillei TaxID=2014 RepID=UPI0033CE74B0
MSSSVESYSEIKKINSELNISEMREGAKELSSMPRYVMIELTQGCNLTCSMCRSKSIGYREREMDRSILKSVSHILFPSAEMVDIRGWGESLLAPDIADIISLVNDYGARCRVVTNLSLNRPSVLDQLIEMNAMIDVSLDAPNQDILDVARTGARFALIDKNLRRLADGLRSRHGSTEALRIVATVQRSTLYSLSDLVDYAAQTGVSQIVLNEVTLAPGDLNAVTDIPDQVDEQVALAATRAAEVGVKLFAGTRFGTRVGLRKEIDFCIHPWSYVTVGYDGSIGYCDHLIGPMMQFYCMGDVVKQEFHQIWNGETWQRLRGWHAAGHSTEEPTYRACFQCYRHRNVDFEDVFEPRLKRYRLDLEADEGGR